MKIAIINRSEKYGKYIVGYSNDTVERVNPLKYYTESIISHRIITLYELTKEEYKKKKIPDEIAKKVIYKRVTQDWKTEFDNLLKIELPDNFIALLDSKSKRDQEKLLKNQKITSFQIFSFICKAYKEFGYTYSQYKSEILSKDTIKKNMPIYAEIKEKNIEKVGSTKYTDGKIKQIIEQRKVIVAKILDRGKEWQCFILTFNSLKGNEIWNGGTPHLHYLSDKWGLTRERLIENIKSGNYPSTSVHIELLDC
jgi:hypothetical protein